jgi:hypothetical protein
MLLKLSANSLSGGPSGKTGVAVSLFLSARASTNSKGLLQMSQFNPEDNKNYITASFSYSLTASSQFPIGCSLLDEPRSQGFQPSSAAEWTPKTHPQSRPVRVVFF